MPDKRKVKRGFDPLSSFSGKLVPQNNIDGSIENPLKQSA
jgi:hypothetical protein